MIHQAGAKLFYLPSYSPDLNSTEKLWAKVKAFLRKRRALTPEALQRRDRLRLPVLHLLIAETGLHKICVSRLLSSTQTLLYITVQLERSNLSPLYSISEEVSER